MCLPLGTQSSLPDSGSDWPLGGFFKILHSIYSSSKWSQSSYHVPCPVRDDTGIITHRLALMELTIQAEWAQSHGKQDRFKQRGDAGTKDVLEERAKEGISSTLAALCKHYAASLQNLRLGVSSFESQPELGSSPRICCIEGIAGDF